MPCRLFGLAFERTGRLPELGCGVARNRFGILDSGVPAVAFQLRDEETFVFIIGIDPHKGSHIAAVITATNNSLASFR